MRFTIALAFASAACAFAAPVEQVDSNVERRASGRATYYYQNGNAGHCGNHNSDGAYIVALDSSVFDMGKCGKTVKVTNTKTGKSQSAKVADSCPTCGGAGNIDLSKALYDSISGGADGVFPVSWSFE